MAWWSGLFLLGVLFRGYLGYLLSRSVLGLQKVTSGASLFLWLWMPFSSAFFAFKAFALASALEGAGPSFFAFGAIFMKRPYQIINQRESKHAEDREEMPRR